MLFIVRRSDSKDSAVPPEPVGPMEVAGCDGRTDRVHTYVYRSIEHPRYVWQRPSDIVIVFAGQDTNREQTLFITRKHLSRRTVLRGLGAAIALPVLESMLPAMTPEASRKTRLICIENVHGAAGSTKIGSEKNLWAPAGEGRNFDLAEGNLVSLEPWKDYLTVVSNMDYQTAEAWTIPEAGGDHYRSSAVFLTCAHPKQTQGSDIFCGTSMDQLYAQRVARETPLTSIQLSIEGELAGGCSYNYACVYMDSISWAGPSSPLPMIRDPRLAFEMMFGGGGTPAARAERMSTDRSLLDFVADRVAALKSKLPVSDRVRVDNYLESVREVEQRIERIEERNQSGEVRELPTAPVGVPDDYDEHVKLMFDLQVAAFEADITRVSAFKMSRDVSGRSFPPSGVTASYHGASHHGENEQRIIQFGKINQYHVGLVAYFADKLKRTPDGDSNLLDNSLIIYGGAMGNGNLHNHKRVPMFLVGHAGGQLEGSSHLKTPDGTPAANMHLTLLNKLGFDDMQAFGDSSGTLDL